MPPSAHILIYVLMGTTALQVLLLIIKKRLAPKQPVAAHIQQQLDLTRRALDAAPVAMGMVDLHGRLTFANQALITLWGYGQAGDMQDKALVDFFLDPVEVIAGMQALKKNRAWQAEIAATHHDGSRFQIEVHAHPLPGHDGKPLGFTAHFTDPTERRKVEQKLRKLAYYDSLTDLPNRIMLQDRMNLALGHAARLGESVILFTLDLDNFKQINESLGHAKGDAILRQLATRLGKTIGQGDTLVRWGGDEFVLLLTGYQDEAAIAREARRILDSVSEHPFELDGSEVFTSASMGIALFPRDGEEQETLLKHAETALYEAKKHGGNVYQFFSEPLQQKIVALHQMDVNLRRALRQEEFFLAYQPQMDLRTGRPVGIEALVRWMHPQLGLISPAQFIPLAEESGLIRPLGKWILRTACREAMSWWNAGRPSLRLAVNFSTQQFRQTDMLAEIESVLQETGFPAHLLELEITESAFLENMADAIEVLVDLKTRGIQIAIDDFGTGYSSLSYLKNFPIDRIKIAQTFVRDIPADPEDMAIVDAIIAMATRLGLELVAEGVEMPEQMQFLRECGCHIMQGFHFAKPMPAAQMADFLCRSWPMQSTDCAQASLHCP